MSETTFLVEPSFSSKNLGSAENLNDRCVQIAGTWPRSPPWLTLLLIVYPKNAVDQHEWETKNRRESSERFPTFQTYGTPA
ncbi:hypothetical protein N24_1510 [Corynebacterium suranareeae]|uniref:Uncharacterized protein n=1 Tax=Corynebacterium suranareeae TaxID=2506452 RepID=A0A161J8B2_9CORY|nr:hypothetical protein N24_1510 [Corynebacterium suranareeae]